jgi:hypothetical protein
MNVHSITGPSGKANRRCVRSIAAIIRRYLHVAGRAVRSSTLIVPCMMLSMVSIGRTIGKPKIAPPDCRCNAAGHSSVVITLRNSPSTVECSVTLSRIPRVRRLENAPSWPEMPKQQACPSRRTGRSSISVAQRQVARTGCGRRVLEAAYLARAALTKEPKDREHNGGADPDANDPPQHRRPFTKRNER